MEIIEPREVMLSDRNALTGQRTLPVRGRSLIGAWCFIDHITPTGRETGDLYALPHPHTGLQTVTWLFAGTIEHTDSVGSRQLVRPGSLSLMTAGSGIASAISGFGLEGVQLRLALPEVHRHTAPTYLFLVPTPVAIPGAQIRVFLGELAGSRSPATTFTPLLGSEIVLAPGAEVLLNVDPTFEHAVLVDRGPVLVGPDSDAVQRSQLGYLPMGADTLRLVNPEATAARVVLLGGTPFGEPVVMWWNFMGRSGDEIARYREQWNAEVSGTNETVQFGAVPGFDGAWIQAPRMPTTPLLPRR